MAESIRSPSGMSVCSTCGARVGCVTTEAMVWSCHSAILVDELPSSIVSLFAIQVAKVQKKFGIRYLSILK